MSHYRTGMRLTAHDPRTLHFGSFLAPDLGPAPVASDNLATVGSRLGIKTGIRNLFPMYANDRLGDCTIAAKWHAETLFAGLLGRREVAAESVVIDEYTRLGNGQDVGLDPLVVLKDWRASGRILAYASVDPHSPDIVRHAISLFKCLYVGFRTQAQTEQQFEANIPWSAGSVTKDGHMVMIPNYLPEGFLVSTWGAFARARWPWTETWDTAWVVIPREAADPSFAPGFDVPALMAKMAQITQ